MEDSGIAFSESSQSVLHPFRRNTIRPGKLKKVLLKNFMCHDHFEIEFNSCVNFIHGRNGSGKSAIATALVLGFGQRATATNRGVAVKSFIKRGRHMATIEVTLYNCGGGMVFKQEKFGNEITLIRKITENSGSQYRIRGEIGSEEVLTRIDLDSLLLHFNIQPQNPLCILSQDTARSFFKSRDPAQMYKLFMQGTQLESVSESYQKNVQHRIQLMKDCEKREEELKKIYEDVVEADIKQEIVAKLRDVQEKKKHLDIELVWTKMKLSEAKLSEGAINLKKASDEAEEYEKKESSSGSSKKELAEEKEKFENELVELQNNLEDVNNQLKLIGDRNVRRKNQLRIKMENIEMKKKQIDNLEDNLNQLKIAVENFQSKHSQIEETKQKLAELVNKIQETDAAIKTTQTYCGQLDDTINELSNQIDAKNQELNSHFAKKRDLELKVQQLKEGNSLGVYGHWMPKLLVKIEQAYQHGNFDSKPHGPLGAFIKVVDEDWAPAIESLMGRLLSAFCLSSQKDLKVFNMLVEQVIGKNENISRPVAITSKFFYDVHNYEQYEVKLKGYRSLISCLNISDNVVANALIDQMQIEQILLVPDTDSALDCMERQENVPKSCKFTLTKEGETIYPAPNYRFYSGNARNRAQILQTDVSQQIREIQNNLISLDKTCKTLDRDKINVLKEVREAQENILLQKKELKKLISKKGSFNVQKTELEKNIEIEPQAIQLYKDDIVDSLATKEAYFKEIQGLKNEVNALNADIQNANEEINDNLLKKSELNKNINIIRENVNNIDQRLREWHRRKDEFKRQLNEKNERVKELQKQLEKSEKEYNNIKNIVEKDNLEEVEVKRNLEVIQKEINRCQTSIKVFSQELGGDSEVVSENHLRKKRLYNDKKKTIEQLKACIGKSGSVLESELKSYQRIKTYQTLLAESTFKNLLKVRNLKGKLVFDFDNKKLHIVAIPNVEGSTAETSSSLSSLSGGERSYATTAFIRALWNSMTAPFYVLDEFDVFTDLSNRTQIIQLLIDHAKNNLHCQYLFITPLDLSHIVTDDMVVVHLIRNPRDEDI